MKSGSTPTYSYDAENRLIATAGVTYTYDGDGKRVKKSNGMLYWTGTSSDALVETDLSGNTTAEYVFFNGRRIARIDQPANSIEYYYSDHLGSTDVVTNATGTIVKESDYYPYGGEIPIITGDSNRYKFNGKERDTESGLDNFGARYDSSSLGRFMTPDWAARPTAVPYAVFGDPQSLNLYGYVRNDPVSRADLDGHAAEADAFRNWGDWSPLSYGMFGMTTLAADLLSRSTMQNQEIRAQQQAKNEINTKPPTPDPAGVRTKPAPNRPPANSRTDVVLFGAGAGKPLIHNAIEWEMRWIAGTCSGDSCHKDDNLTITGVEIDGVKPLGPISDRPKKGEISDWISIESRKITQWWSLDGKQVQVVLGPDGKGGVVKTWGVEIQVHGGYKNPPTYSPASAIEPPQ